MKNRKNDHLSKIKNIMKKITIILLTICLCSCQRTITDKIVASLKNNTQPDTCVISMKDFTSFEWDKMYAFCNNVGVDEVERTLKMDFPSDDLDEINRIVFTKCNKIVYHEDLFVNPEKADPINFISIKGKDVMVFTKSTAIFKVKKLGDPDWIYYDLTPVRKKKSCKRSHTPPQSFF